MNNYRCTLSKDGYIKEQFYRQANSLKELIDGIELFEWDGQWNFELNCD